MDSQVISHHLTTLQQKLDKAKLSLMDIQMMKMMLQELEPYRNEKPAVQEVLAAAEARIAERMVS